MKKLVIAIATVIAAAAMASSATATGPVYEDSGFLCAIATPVGFVFTYDSSFVVYGSGKATLKCTANTDYSGDRVVLSPKNTGLGCGYYGLSLPNWKSITGSNGQAVLTCNGHVDLNAMDAARSAGGASGN